jgi:hypothetical protein
MHPSMNFDFPEAVVSEDLEIQAFTESLAARAETPDPNQELPLSIGAFMKPIEVSSAANV